MMVEMSCCVGSGCADGLAISDRIYSGRRTHTLPDEASLPLFLTTPPSHHQRFTTSILLPTMFLLSTATVAIAAATAGLVSAAPLADKRADGINDGVILNYALTLEHLEDTFYRQGLANFTEDDFRAAGFDATFYGNVKKVSADETAHVGFLTEALKAAGVAPVAECTYSFGVTDVKTFLATASILEGVGVSAYLGAAADIMSKTYLTAAGSILTVEARHSSYIRAGLKQAPFAQPFDAPLSINEVYSLASQFIVSCPKENPPLPVKAFPKLVLDPKTQMPVKTGDTVTLLTPDYTLKGAKGQKVYAAFIAVTGPTFVEATPVQGGFSVKIPEGFAGQSYVVLTGCNDSVSDDTVAAGPAIIEGLAWNLTGGYQGHYGTPVGLSCRVTGKKI
ncbi:2-methylisocitrate lyase, mitochondrial [Purpureocillium lavendulum]|uniref:2-methylisocitrate lyase, mitochondrial n=1 Tax=Purpureocillium lavendulum TaxID=1247861 RepID=A0AB34GA56_9HYPO|nr:2-methylisocitrate lyase, mitochondrial [Purpureocillium lavendulum]